LHLSVSMMDLGITIPPSLCVFIPEGPDVPAVSPEIYVSCFLFLVDLHPMTQVGSSRMCLDPDVVPPLAVFRLFAIPGDFHHVLSVPSVCIFKTAHCF
jgi:hypothetical protein